MSSSLPVIHSYFIPWIDGPKADNQRPRQAASPGSLMRQKAKSLHKGGLYTLYAGAPFRVMPSSASRQIVQQVIFERSKLLPNPTAFEEQISKPRLDSYRGYVLASLDYRVILEPQLAVAGGGLQGAQSGSSRIQNACPIPVTHVCRQTDRRQCSNHFDDSCTGQRPGAATEVRPQQ